MQVEVATFRSDVGYSDGRHPDAVVYAESAEEDVKRRDFTINGLLLDPRNNEVLDYVGGRDDLHAGIIRAIGQPEERFREDKLSMLRAVRFAARFGYSIEPETLRAIQKLAPEVNQVSAERLRDELTKLLTEGAARRGFELLDETGLLLQLLPEISRMKGVEQPPQFHPEGDVWIHTRMMLEGLQPVALQRWPGVCCCTTSASRRLLRPPQDLTAGFASTATSRSARAWPKTSAARLRFSNDDS